MNIVFALCNGRGGGHEVHCVAVRYFEGVGGVAGPKRLKIELYTQKYLLFLATVFNINISHLTLTPLVTFYVQLVNI